MSEDVFNLADEKNLSLNELRDALGDVSVDPNVKGLPGGVALKFNRGDS